MRNPRQLVAILFADITGFTAMMQEDEVLAMNSRKKLEQAFNEEAAKHNGQIIEFKGDGVLCSFSSTTECVKASISIQKQMQTAPVVPLRIGIHTGDVIFDNDNIYGDGVNVASRLESFAVPGSIFISAKVYDDVKNKKEIETRSLGFFHFKNVKDNMEIFCISNPGLVVPDANYLKGKGEKAYPKASEKSIAVLPFVNLSNDPSQEYFSDGIAEEILGSLSQLKDLKVAGRSSSFQFKGKDIDPSEVGNKLHVDTILEGSVRKQDKRVRISARLINAKNGFHLWSEKFDRDMDDIFAIQDEIATAITEKLKVTLLHQEKRSLYKTPTKNQSAYDLYLKGRFFWNKRGKGLQQGLTCFIQATILDEHFALAHAGIADTYALLAFYSMLPPDEAIPKALDAAQKAIREDPGRVEPYSVLPFVSMFYNWNWIEARKQFEKIFEMNPRYAPAHYWYSQYLCWIERDCSGAVTEARYAIELEPLVSHSHHLLAFVNYNYGLYKEALEAAKMAVELDAGSFLAYSSMGMSYLGLNQIKEAEEALKRSLELSGRHQYPLAQLFYLYTKTGDERAAKSISDELITRSEKEYISGTVLAMIAYTYKEFDKAIQYTEKAFEQHDNVLTWIGISQLFSFFRTDKRFIPYLERMHFLGEGSGNQVLEKS